MGAASVSFFNNHDSLSKTPPAHLQSSYSNWEEWWSTVGNHHYRPNISENHISRRRSIDRRQERDETKVVKPFSFCLMACECSWLNLKRACLMSARALSSDDIQVGQMFPLFYLSPFLQFYLLFLTSFCQLAALTLTLYGVNMKARYLYL